MTATSKQSLPETSSGTLHLTRIVVPYREAIGSLKIRDSYDWHQRAWQAFAGRDGQARDFLTRVDRQDDAFRVLILSGSPAARPDWCAPAWFDTKIIPDEYLAHTNYRFNLLVNPTRKLRVDRADGSRKKNGKRVPLSQRDDLILWLQRKAQDGGFAVNVETLRIIPRGRAGFRKGNTHGHHGAVEFQGELSVSDPALFRLAVARGIGSAKAFGFGLLMTTPLT